MGRPKELTFASRDLKMPIQGADGTWWSDDRRYYLRGNQWIPAPGNSGAGTSTQQTAGTSTQQTAGTSTQQTAGTSTQQTISAYTQQMPDASTHQTAAPSVGTSGIAPGLTPEIRTLASRNRFVWNFVQAYDAAHRKQMGT
jgi:hypothetical protein